MLWVGRPSDQRDRARRANSVAAIDKMSVSCYTAMSYASYAVLGCARKRGRPMYAREGNMDDSAVSKDALRSGMNAALALAVARSRTEESDLDELEALFRRVDMTAKEHPTVHARLIGLINRGDVTKAYEELERFERGDVTDQ